MRMRITVSFLAAAAATLVIGLGQAKATLLESWENPADPTFDGWTTNLQAYAPSYSAGVGATNGLESLAMTGTASPTYGQMLRSSFFQSYTTALANATAIQFDVFTPPGSFGFFLQWDMDINNTDTGFTSLDGFNYQGVAIGGETTLTVPISAALAATLAASSNPTQLIFQVGGGSSGNPQTFYLDNIRTVAAVPEPTSLLLAGLSIPALIALGRRRFGRRG